MLKWRERERERERGLGKEKKRSDAEDEWEKSLCKMNTAKTLCCKKDFPSLFTKKSAHGTEE